MSTLKEYTKGSESYFAEREARITAHIDEAKSKIDEIETRIRAEIVTIQEQRDRLRTHLEGFIDARNELVRHHESTVGLIAELQSVVSVCDEQLPQIDAMLDELEAAAQAKDDALETTEKSRHRQLHKHERKKTRFELRQARLQLRKRLFFGEAEVNADEAEKAGM